MSESLPENMSAAARTRARLGRHLTWARAGGVGRLIEEDNLDPRARARAAFARARWRREHGVAPGQARAVFVVGVQRSGTNMLTHGLDAMPEVEVHNENDGAIFDRFQLRDHAVVLKTVARSAHQVVLFKPICDSHDTDRLLDAFAHAANPARALWAYRAVDDRVRSAVAKFGWVNQQVLARIAATGIDGSWQAGRMTPQLLDDLRACDPASLSAESGAALFWWLRNSLYFETGLDVRPDVMPVSYDDIIADPQERLRAVCEFVGLPYRPEVAAHVDGRSRRSRKAPLDLDPRVRRRCDDLGARLDDAARGFGRQ